MFRWLAPCLTALMVATSCLAQATPAPPALAILISIDAFRPDYLDRGVTPVMSGLAAEGARGAMRPSFPSKTYPNHYAMVTGQRPDRNGIVANNMRDPAIPGVMFSMANHAAVADRRWWDEAEPIWVSAERAGMITAPMFWPGADAAVHGILPHFNLVFDQAIPSDARVDRLLAWLDLPAGQRPVFATLYFDIVDSAGHDHGPDSAEVNAAAATVDAAIGRLIAGLKARGLAANLVIVADHGMTALSPDRQVYMDDLVPNDAYRTLDTGAFMTIYPAEGRKMQVERALFASHPHLQCWPKAKIPARLHYGRNPRVAPILCLADAGWTLTTHDFKRAKPELGDHGYDPASPDMAAVFIANGPAFRRGVVLPAFDNVDVYPLLARLLRLTPEPGDGRLQPLTLALAP